MIEDRCHRCGDLEWRRDGDERVSFGLSKEYWQRHLDLHKITIHGYVAVKGEEE